MKYWLLTTEYPPFFGGGISTYCSFSASMLAEKGHEVTVFVNDSTVKELEITSDSGWRVVRFNSNLTNSFSFLGHVTNISYEFAHIVKQFIEKEGKPDIIEAQEYLGIAYYLLQFKYLQYDWCRDVPVLVTMHSPSFLYLEYNHVALFKYPNYWIGEMERFCIKAADLVISPSRYLVTEIKARFSFEHKNLHILPNPFERKEEVRLPVEKGMADQIIFLGKLSAQKGTIKLLSYFRNLWNSGFEESLYLIGGQDIVYHPEGKTMGDLVRKNYKSFMDKGLLKLENRIAPAAIKARLSKAKVVIIPSTVDNLPYVVMEMMSLGLVVLVSKQGGQAEIVQDDINGFVFDHQNPETFYSQLSKILSLGDDKVKTIRENAIRRIREEYIPEVIYGKKLEIIQSVIGQQTGRSEFPFIRPSNPEKMEPAGATFNDLLSVVVPYFNMGAYIYETIRSVRSTDYKKIEIIIVNDGSTDPASLEKLETYRQDSNITVLDTPNRGLAAARNLGATTANGSFLTFLDADDLVTPDYYSKAVKVLKALDNVHFVGCWTQYFEDSEKEWPTFNPEPPLILYHNLVNSSALVYKKETFLASGMNDGNMPFQGLEDYDSVVSLVTNGYGGVVLPELLFRYRVRRDSMIRGISKAKKQILQDYIASKHANGYNLYGGEVFSLVNANGPSAAMDNPSLDYDLTDKLPFNNDLSRKLILLVKKNKFAKYLAYRAYKLINK